MMFEDRIRRAGSVSGYVGDVYIWQPNEDFHWKYWKVTGVNSSKSISKLEYLFRYYVLRKRGRFNE